MASLSRIGSARLDRPALVALVAAVCTMVGVPAVCAQEGSDADHLFREGVALREAGDTEGAIDRLRTAHRIDPGDRTAYNLAAALVDAGRLVEARSLLRRILASPRELLIVDAAEELLAVVTPRIASVSLTIEDDRRDLRLVVDGAASDVGPVGARAVSLDPGRHRFEVRDQGGAVLARSEVEVGEGERRSLVLRPVASPARTAGAAVASVSPATAGDPSDETWMWVGIGAGVAVAITVVAVVLAVALGGGGGGVEGDAPGVVVRSSVRDE